MGEGDFPGRLSAGDAAELGNQLASVTRAGFPLPPALRALGSDFPRGRLRTVMERLAESVESGASLDEAVDRQKGRFPSYLRGLLQCGAKTGKLGEILTQFAVYSGVGTDLRRSLWLRLMPPFISLSFAATVYVFVSVVLINSFASLFQDFGIPTPKLTHFILSVGGVISRIWLPAVEIGAVATVVWFLAGLFSTRSIGRRLLATIPILGRVLKLSALAEFSHLLALLVENGVNLVEALPMAAAAVQHGEIEERSRSVARDIAAGRPFEDSLVARRLFPLGLTRILSWAQQHQELPDALHMAGEMFEAQARSQANFVSILVGMFAILSIVGGVTITTLAILVPMVSLMSALSG